MLNNVIKFTFPDKILPFNEVIFIPEPSYKDNFDIFDFHEKEKNPTERRL